LKEMTLVEHLEDLRKMVIRILMILVVSFFVCYAVSDYIVDYLLAPLGPALEAKKGQIIYLSIFDKILAIFQVSFFCSVILSSPFWFVEVWRFIRPGLYDKEARLIKPFIIAGFVLFWCGVLFGYYIAFPITFKLLLEMGTDKAQASISLLGHLATSCKILVLLGFMFQLPNVLVILGFMGLVTKYSLRKIRGYVYLGLCIFSALVTPPDVLTLFGVWVPLIILYELGIIAVGFIVHPKLKDLYE
jgi:sec-independent protein translocase protein TatC